ncbi:MAG: NCS2 family permease [Spirochaetales bacterium]|nr:NCS2 family permease [Spirochaetales bacterium]
MSKIVEYFRDPFKLKEHGATVSKEIIGGVTTFLAISYILAVNPDMLGNGAGMGFAPVFTATALSAMVATLIMGFFANLPIALASGMGLNAFFAFTICGQMGLSWQLALTAVFVEGIIFIILSFFGVREAIIRSIPMSLRKAVSVGIGMFIALIGLTNAGITTGDNGTIISFVNFNHASALVAIIGLIITIMLYIMNIPGAILISIILTTLIGLPFGVTTIPDNFRPISLPEPPLWFQFDFGGMIFNEAGKFSFAVLGQFLIILVTFLFTDMFDTIGTLMGVADQAGLTDEKGNIKNVKPALMSDAIGTVIGACCGTSTVTSYVESTTGVAAGAKTGLASVVTSVMFMIAIFFSPCFALIPAAATAPALIFVGFLMMAAIKDINFQDLSESIPGFMTIMTMPFAYSIAKGIAFGMISYIICKIAAKKIKEIPIVTWIVAIIFLANFIFEALK